MYWPYDQYYKYVIQARENGRYSNREDWPELGQETYLLSLYTQNIHRCLVLAKGSYSACQVMLGGCFRKTLKSNHNLLIRANYMGEIDHPFRVTYNGGKRKIDTNNDVPSKKQKL